ncbi:unnamed protein product [Blepharisma stoltei]|uniref:Uncharacterized protein n=1 Tax=Blepharisma stoltei TaxID=1481888 RepID=A0AAU9JBB5_9CILI|nr:unnamed protein product [Blepharisma stoltei]
MGCSALCKVNVKFIESEGETTSRNVSNNQLLRSDETNRPVVKESNNTLNFDADGKVYKIKVSFVGTPNSSRVLP